MTPGSEPRHAAPPEAVEDRVTEEIVEEIVEEQNLAPGGSPRRPTKSRSPR